MLTAWTGLGSLGWVVQVELGEQRRHLVHHGKVLDELGRARAS